MTGNISATILGQIFDGMSNNECPGTKYEEPTSCGSCDLVM